MASVVIAAGSSREKLYLTNAVKHFRFTPKGKKRLHQPPRVGHIDHCRWWLDAERQLIRPRLTLALGATAIRALCHKPLRIEDARRAEFTCFDGGKALASFHPAAILRQKSLQGKNDAFRSLVNDLRRAMDWLNDATLMQTDNRRASSSSPQ